MPAFISRSDGMSRPMPDLGSGDGEVCDVYITLAIIDMMVS
ncbi:MAG: hypothetical protein SH859_06155 [Hyphomicrobium aestuarii]|nr:hypothetical protein [Hyphomicrobium aestuarii]